MHNGGGSEKHVTVPSAVAGPRTGPVCRAMADQSVTESQDDSQKTRTEWGPVEHAERTSFPLEIRIWARESRLCVHAAFPLGRVPV